jgi:hypothetical protein
MCLYMEILLNLFVERGAAIVVSIHNQGIRHGCHREFKLFWLSEKEHLQLQLLYKWHAIIGK